MKESAFSSSCIQVANMRFTALTSSIITAFSLLIAATPMPEVFYSTFTIRVTAHCSLYLAE